MFRIQKLMLTEYTDLYEPIIVENPFTQVTSSGLGLRQYHIGLTCSKIIFCCDDFNKLSSNHGPEIETLNLLNIIPLEYVRFKFLRKRQRYLMLLKIFEEEQQEYKFAATAANDDGGNNGDDGHNEIYLEFGGHIFRDLFWKMWREQIFPTKLQEPNIFNGNILTPHSFTDATANEELCYVVNNSDPSYSIGSCSLGYLSDELV